VSSPQDAAAARQSGARLLWPLTLCLYPFVTVCMGRLEATIAGFQEELEVDFAPAVLKMPRVALQKGPG